MDFKVGRFLHCERVLASVEMTVGQVGQVSLLDIWDIRQARSLSYLVEMTVVRAEGLVEMND